MPKIITDEKMIDEVLSRGVEEAIEMKSLKKKLLSGKQLRIKFGIDPTSPDLHLGHTVPLGKLRQFQELGHQVILLMGDFTACIGDPSGKNEARKMLSREDVKKNLKDYQAQAAKVLDMEKVEVRFNSEWYDKMGYAFLFELTSKFTVARILERDDFKKRMKEDVDVSMLEILYPLLQGYDSVALEADVEIGGTDQKFNLLMGRKVQRRYEKREQDVVMVPLLEGLDGVNKMSKSLGNYIGIAEQPENMLGKIMSIPDTLIVKYFTLLTKIPQVEIFEMEKQLQVGKVNPRDLKLKLATEIVKIYHGEKAAAAAQENFEKVFSKRGTPDVVAEIEVSPEVTIIEVMVSANLAESNADAKRKIKQGGVKINDEVIDSVETVITPEMDGQILKVGKREFRKLKVKK